MQKCKKIFKSGFVSIVGRPNVGKSTLLNKLTGEKIAIMSDKPQTTRNTIKSVVTGTDFQIVFMDTPGIHKPKTKLGNYMVGAAKNTISEVDTVLFLIEAIDKSPGAGDLLILEQLEKEGVPVILIINKIDIVKKDALLEVIANYSSKLKFESVIPISALNGEGTDAVMDEIKKLLPEGPQFFPEDMLTDQPEKVIAAELIREKILTLTDEEVPHGTGVEILSFKEREGKNIIDIQATIYCEKASHKGIIIGKGGSMLKKIGSLAREEMEKFLDTKVNLQLWVKVKPDWRNSDNMLKELGYKN
jgi:GTP-binding protein Era